MLSFEWNHLNTVNYLWQTGEIQIENIAVKDEDKLICVPKQHKLTQIVKQQINVLKLC